MKPLTLIVVPLVTPEQLECIEVFSTMIEKDIGKCFELVVELIFYNGFTTATTF